MTRSIRSTLLCLTALTVLSGCSITLIKKSGSDTLAQGLNLAREGNSEQAAKAYYETMQSTTDDRVKSKAMGQLASLYRDGRGVEKNLTRYVELLTLASELGNEKAIFDLSRVYRNGISVPVNVERADALLDSIKTTYPMARVELAKQQATMALQDTMDQGAPTEPGLLDSISKLDFSQPISLAEALQTLKWKAANHPEGSAPLTVARLYHDGGVVEKDDELAEEYYRSAIAAGNASAATELAWMWIDSASRQNYVGDATNLLEQAANAGFVPAMKDLGKIHQSGLENQPQLVNLDQAKMWYQKAADLNDGGAMRMLGKLYIAQNTSSSTKTGVEWLEKALASGQSDTLIDLGRIYRDGARGAVRPNRQKAFSYFNQAHEAGVKKATLEIARAYEKGHGVGRNQARAVELYKESAASGVNSAQAWLGRAYLNGTGVPRDPAKALTYLEMAKTSGASSVWRDLASIYEKGIGVPKDATKATFYHTKAALAGKSASALWLANAYRYGQHGIKPDQKQSFSWLQTAATSGNKGAMYELSKAYKAGRGTTRNTKLANHWFNKSGKKLASAKKKSASGKGKKETNLMSMAKKYEKGRGVKADLGKAFSYYLQAAKAGDAKAMMKVAKSYSQGYGTAAKPSEAIKWYEKAGKAGVSQAYVNVARAHAIGSGTAQNATKAITWYEKAANAGNADGAYQAGLAYARGTGVSKDPVKAKKYLTLAQERGYSSALAVLESLQKK